MKNKYIQPTIMVLDTTTDPDILANSNKITEDMYSKQNVVTFEDEENDPSWSIDTEN